MLYPAASAEVNPHSAGLTGQAYHNPAHAQEAPSHIAKATKTSELPMQAAFEMMRYQMVNSALNTDITRGVNSAASALKLLPTVIRNIS